MDMMKLYWALPVSVQNIVCGLQGYQIEKHRYPANFNAILEKFQDNDKLSLKQVQKVQVKKLKKLLLHCRDNVPYYTDLFRKIGFDPEKFSSLEDLQVLPILTKADINRDYDKFLNRNADKGLLVMYTGGTTGASLKLQKTYIEETIKWAIWWRYRYRLGINRNTTEARFASNQVVPLDQSKPPYWRVNKPGKVLFFSQYHLNSMTVKSYVDELRRQNIQWIHGYASIISNLANLMLEEGLRLEIPYVTVGAENLYVSQKNAIKQAFGVEPYQHYGQGEASANFSQWPDGKIRVDEDFCFVEFVKQGDKDLVVGTNLYNYMMPFIRYSTGDCAVLDNQQDGGFRIVADIIGREGEFVTLKSGVHISAEALDTNVFAYIPHLAGTQIVQNNLDKLDVNVRILNGWNAADEAMLLDKLSSVIGADMNINIEVKDELIKSKNGKHRLVISNF